MNRDSNTTELYTIIDRAIDEAMLNNRFMFKMYDYLRLGKWTRRDTNEFIESASAAQLSNLVEELDAYIKGGDKQLREAYVISPNLKQGKLKTIFMQCWTMLGGTMLTVSLVGKRKASLNSYCKRGASWQT